MNRAAQPAPLEVITLAALQDRVRELPALPEAVPVATSGERSIANIRMISARSVSTKARKNTRQPPTMAIEVLRGIPRSIRSRSMTAKKAMTMMPMDPWPLLFNMVILPHKQTEGPHRPLAQ